MLRISNSLPWSSEVSYSLCVCNWLEHGDTFRRLQPTGRSVPARLRSYPQREVRAPRMATQKALLISFVSTPLFSQTSFKSNFPKDKANREEQENGQRTLRRSGCRASVERARQNDQRLALSRHGRSSTSPRETACPSFDPKARINFPMLSETWFLILVSIDTIRSHGLRSRKT